jgi:hypothetical protein
MAPRQLTDWHHNDMPIPESDVAILVPAFGRKVHTMCAVRSALASGAGEVIVSLDTDPDRIASDLREVPDPRLRVVIQPCRLGLWPNHLALLHQTRYPFVKFLQTDDRLLPDGLRRLCEAVDSDTTVVSGQPYYQALDTMSAWRLRTPTEPGRWTSADYLRRAEIAGNELGCPSETLLRRLAVPTGEGLWREEVSADWAVNLIAASRGVVAVVPRGTVVIGVHAGQDSVTQGPRLTTARLVNTLEFLHDHFGARCDRIVSCQATAGVLTIARNCFGYARRGTNPFYQGVSGDLTRLLRLVDWPTLRSRAGFVRAVEAVVFQRRTWRAAVTLSH